uniref:Protein FAM179B-like n=1 Tax=Phallusia mammillata TaxID=59560 RepID=A0A6F9DD31_9ASCI|nr:protein FAM179B-like [Phallusia mammillata]
MARYAKEPVITFSKLKHQIFRVEQLQSEMAKSVEHMEEYLSNQFDEKLVMELLFSERKRDGLNYLDEHLRDGQTFMVVGDKTGLFKGFSSALSDGGQQVRIHCTRLIAKIVPQLGTDIDIYMCIVLPEIVANIGSQSVTLQKESIQTLHLYMKHSSDVFQIFRVIAFNGMQNTDLRTREQVIHKFPTLMFTDFRKEDFFDIVYGLATNLIDLTVDKNVIVQTIKKLVDFIGETQFNVYVEQLPNTLKVLFTEQLSEMLNKIPESTHYSDRKPVEHQSLFSNDFPHNDLRRTHKGRSKLIPSNAFSDVDFVPQEVISSLTSSDFNLRLESALTLKQFVTQNNNLSHLKKTIIPLFSLLQPMIEDQNMQISLIALDIFDSVIQKLGGNLSDYLKLFVFAVSKKFGSNKDAVRSSCNKVVLHAMESVGPQSVLDLLWPKLQHKHAKVREDTINIVIATLLTYPGKGNKFEENYIAFICKHISILLLDPKPTVRQACLDCFAVIAHLLGPNASSLKPISNAVDQVELQHDEANGVMSAVHARLIRKQLPRLNEQTLVEYAAFPPSTAPMSSPQGADLQWILSAGLSKLARSNPKFERASLRKKSFKTGEVTVNDQQNKSTRRYLSAGKQRQFPWSSLESDISKHPQSAPMQIAEHEKMEKRPPIVPKKMWEVESTNKSFNSSNKQKPSTIKTEGPTYQELYMKKKGITSRPSLLQLAQGQGSSSMYLPSFATSSSTAVASVLSSSCPSNFFQTHSAKKIQEVSKPEESNLSRKNASPYPIPLKPTLARSAAKRREKNASMSELDQQANSGIEKRGHSAPKDQQQNLEHETETKLKQIEILQVSHDHEGSITNASSSDETTKKLPTSNPMKHSIKGKQKSIVLNDISATNVGIYQSGLFDPPSLDDETHLQEPPFTPEVTQHPRNQKDSDEFFTQISSIRRSAQNKRQQLKSQPSNIASRLSEPTCNESKESFSMLQSEVDLQSDTSIEKPATVYSSFKYNPNMGVTFDKKKVGTNVAVIGVGVKISHANGYSPDALAGNWRSSPIEGNHSTTSRSSPFSPTEKNVKKTRSPFSTSPSTSNPVEDNSFNIQGRSMFSSPSSSNELISLTKDGVVHQDSGMVSEYDSQIGCLIGHSVSPKEICMKVNKGSSQPAFFSNSHDKKLQKLKIMQKSSSGYDSAFSQSSIISEASQSRYIAENQMKITSSGTLSEEKQNSHEKNGFAKLPLENPEGSLGDAIKSMDSSNPDDWEKLTNGIFLISRLALFHPDVLGTRIHEVAILLSKSVHSLRSQVSRSSVIAISEIFCNLKRSNLDVITELTIRCLLTEYGKANSFMKEEIDKALHKVVSSAPPTKTLSTILAVGQRHKNKAIRKTTAYFCFVITEKIGAGKTLNGIKDATEKLINAIALFIVDSTQEVRYYGRCIISELMTHSDFTQCLEKFLPAKTAQDIKECAQSIHHRGLGSSSSVAARKHLGTRTSGSAPGTQRPTEYVYQSTSAPPRRKTSSQKRNFTDLDQEQVKILCQELNNGSSDERKKGVKSLLAKSEESPSLISENMTKIMDAYGTLLATANTKLNSVALEAMPKIVSIFGDGLKESLGKLLPDIFKLLQSKPNSQLALKVLDFITEKIDPAHLLHPVGHACLYGSTKSRQIAIGKFREISLKVGSRRLQIVDKAALPILWNLLSLYQGASANQLKREIEQLCQTYFDLFGGNLLEMAEVKGVRNVLQTVLQTKM